MYQLFLSKLLLIVYHFQKRIFWPKILRLRKKPLKKVVFLNLLFLTLSTKVVASNDCNFKLIIDSIQVYQKLSGKNQKFEIELQGDRKISGQRKIFVNTNSNQLGEIVKIQHRGINLKNWNSHNDLTFFFKSQSSKEKIVTSIHDEKKYRLIRMNKTIKNFDDYKTKELKFKNTKISIRIMRRCIQKRIDLINKEIISRNRSREVLLNTKNRLKDSIFIEEVIRFNCRSKNDLSGDIVFDRSKNVKNYRGWKLWRGKYLVKQKKFFRLKSILKHKKTKLKLKLFTDWLPERKIIKEDILQIILNRIPFERKRVHQYINFYRENYFLKDNDNGGFEHYLVEAKNRHLVLIKTKKVTTKCKTSYLSRLDLI